MVQKRFMIQMGEKNLLGMKRERKDFFLWSYDKCPISIKLKSLFNNNLNTTNKAVSTGKTNKQQLKGKYGKHATIAQRIRVQGLS